MSEKPYNYIDDSKGACSVRRETNAHTSGAEGGSPTKETPVDVIVRRKISPILDGYIQAYQKSGTLDEAALQKEIEIAKQGMPAGYVSEVDRLVLDSLSFQQEIEKNRGKFLDLKIFSAE